MIGLMAWATVIEKARDDERTQKALDVSDFQTFEGNLHGILDSLGLADAKPFVNIEDHSKATNQFVPSIKAGNRDGYALFYRLGKKTPPCDGSAIGPKACPKDCIPQQQLTNIGEIIFSTKKKGAVDTAAELRKWWDEQSNCKRNTQQQQFLVIISQLLPTALKDSLEAADKEDCGDYLELMQMPALSP